MIGQTLRSFKQITQRACDLFMDIHTLTNKRLRPRHMRHIHTVYLIITNLISEHDELLDSSEDLRLNLDGNLYVRRPGEDPGKELLEAYDRPATARTPGGEGGEGLA